MNTLSRVLAVALVSLFLCASSAPVLAIPVLEVSAVHLGDGLVQYTIGMVNDEPNPGNVGLIINVAGDIHQVPSTFFPDAPPDGGVDLLSEAEAAMIGDQQYIDNGGKDTDSWWDDTVFIVPFPVTPPDGAVGGFAGSPKFSFFRGTLVDPQPGIVTARIGQIVIDDIAAASLPIGPVTVSANTGVAQLSVTDSDPLMVPSGTYIFSSEIAQQAERFPIDDSFFVQAFDAGAGEDSPLLGFSAAPGIVEYEELGMANFVTPEGAANPGVWIDVELLPGDESLLIRVTEGSLLEIGFPTLAGFADANGNYTVTATDNPFDDTVAPGDFLVFADPISGAGTVVIGDIANGQSSIPIFLATSGTSVTIRSVPEPTTLALAVLGLLGAIGCFGRRCRNQRSPGLAD